MMSALSFRFTATLTVDGSDGSDRPPFAFSTDATANFNITGAAAFTGDLSTSSILSANCTTFRFAVNSVIIGLLCVVGLLGNIVSVTVLHRDRNNRVAVFLLQALSAADCLTLAISFTVLTVFYGTLPEYNPMVLLVIRPYFVRFVNPLGYVAQSATVWMTVLLGVNRYLAICRPFYSPRMLSINGARIQVSVGQATRALRQLVYLFI